jgi:hypothetical protein
VPGAIVGPLVVGLLGDHRTGPIGSIGDAMSLASIALFPVAHFIAWRYVPETMGEDLVAMDEEVYALG